MMRRKNGLSRWTLSMLGAFGLAACDPAHHEKTQNSNDDYPGLGNIDAALLHSGACTVSATTGLSIALDNGETAYLSLRPADNTVIVNAVEANCVLPLSGTTAQPGAFPTGKTIAVVAHGTVAASDSRSVILDYANGVWGEAASGTAGVVNINLGTAASVNNYVKIRGSANADAYYLGKGT